jgi:putative pyruvate formate lyase activating enzyme
VKEVLCDSVTGRQPAMAAIRAPLDVLHDCTCCPRECHADRFSHELGYCRSGAGFAIGSICAHRGEEPVISSRHGICNIFFTGCNMQCLYCQNFQISRQRRQPGEKTHTLPEIVRKVERLLREGSHAVGFVSPSHFVPQLRVIIAELKARGEDPVFVYNTSSYDKADTIRSLDEIIGVWLPDLKYLDESLARMYSDAHGYPEIACAAIREMFRQKGSGIRLDDRGRILSGLIIRHLVLPGRVNNSKRVLRWIAEELSPSVHVSLMSQYHPTPQVANDPQLARTVSATEYDEVLEELERLGFYRGWTQDLDSPVGYRPDFNRDHPFEPHSSCPG